MTELTSRQKWLKEYHDPANPLIGGSRAPIVLGMSHWCSRYELYHQMTGELVPEDRDEDVALARGTALEPVVLGLLAAHTGRTVTAAEAYKRVHHPEHPWLCCTPDGWQEDGLTQRSTDSDAHADRGIVQAKTSLTLKRRDWEADDSEIRQIYLTQLQHEMLATGCTWGTLCVLFMDVGTLSNLVVAAMYAAKTGDPDCIQREMVASLVHDPKAFMWFDVCADREFQNDLFVAEQDFVNRVLTRNPPDTDGSESTMSALRRLHPNDNGQSVPLPNAFLDLAADLRDAKEEKKTIEKRIDAAEAKIKDALGDATYGVLPDGSKFSWKTQGSPHRRNSEIIQSVRDLCDSSYDLSNPELAFEQILEQIETVRDVLGDERKRLPSPWVRVLRFEKAKPSKDA